MCSGKRGWEVRDPGCGRQLLLRWDPELKCSKERGQVHTAPCLPLLATRGPPAWPRRSTEPLQDAGQVSYTPLRHHWLVWGRKLPGWWGPSVVPLGTWRSGPAASVAADRGMLVLSEPFTTLAAGGMGWNEWRDLGHFGLAEQGPHPTVAMPGSWMWRWGRFRQKEGAGMPAQCQQAGWAAWGLCFLSLPRCQECLWQHR